jgi:ATP-dependent Lon protease
MGKGTVIPEMIPSLLGAPKYIRETRLKTSKPGVVTGLAWTPAGGEILYIEALRYPGKGDILLTGQIGEVVKESAQAALSLVKSWRVVKESAQAALSLVKSRRGELGIGPDAFRQEPAW